MAGGSTGMRCYDSAGDATQCQDGTHSCVTFVELTQSNVSGNVSAGPFLNKNTRKCGTSRVFEHWDPIFFTTEDSPMCDPDLCEVVVEATRDGEDGSPYEYVVVIPFGPHPSRETEHKDSRTVDPIWQYSNENLDGEGSIGNVYLEGCTGDDDSQAGAMTEGQGCSAFATSSYDCVALGACTICCMSVVVAKPTAKESTLMKSLSQVAHFMSQHLQSKA